MNDQSPVASEGSTPPRSPSGIGEPQVDAPAALPDRPSSAIRRAAALLRCIRRGDVSADSGAAKSVEAELEEVVDWLMNTVEPPLFTAQEQALVDGIDAAMRGDEDALAAAGAALPAPEVVHVEMVLRHGPILHVKACKCGRTRDTIFAPAINTYRQPGPQELAPQLCSCGRLVVAQKGVIITAPEELLS